MLVGSDYFVNHPSITCSISNTNTAGKYPINMTGAVISNNESYNFVYESGLLTINAIQPSPEPDDRPANSGNNNTDNTATKVVENSDGSKSTIVTNNDGSKTETAVYTNGTKVETTTTKDGEISSKVNLPENVDRAVVTIPSDKKISDNSVAVIIHEDGTKEVISMAMITDDGMKVMLDDNATIVIMYNKKEFNEVNHKDWFNTAVDFVSSREILNGTGKNDFSPNDNMTRAMFATIVSRLVNGKANNDNMFDDVKDNEWYTEGIAWAAENDIVNGYGKEFKPNSEITRQDLVTIMYRFANYLDGDKFTSNLESSFDDFIDADKIQSYANEAMSWAIESGLIEGKGDKILSPDEFATRAEVSVIIQRFIKLMLK